MKRKNSAMRASMHVFEVGALAPWVASERLASIALGSPAAALAQWHSWAVEKAVVCQQTFWAMGLEMMRGGSISPASVSRILQPARARVRRNASRSGRR